MGDLSRHFSTWEWGEVPAGEEVHDELRELARRYLEPTRRKWGAARVTSGFRSRIHNSRIGGAPDSFHVHRPGRRGVAADVVFSHGKPLDWYRTLDALGVPGLGLYGDHVHVDTRRGRARW